MYLIHLARVFSSLNLPYSTTCENDYILFSAYFNLLWGKVGLGDHCAICMCVYVRARVWCQHLD